MSFSWACVAEFYIPAGRLAALQKVEEPWLTDLEDIVEDGFLTDTIYEGNTLRYRSVFGKSDYRDKLEVLEELLATVREHGGQGTLCVVGFDDGPDSGEIFELGEGGVTRSQLLTKEAVDEVRARADYQALSTRYAQAFDEEDAGR
jgi:hypothetical protein